MREIIISRPSRFECSAMGLSVEVNGKRLARIKNGQRIVMSVDEGPQEIRIHGGFMSGKAFQDTVEIPAGMFSYTFQVDFISASTSSYVPLLRPFGGDFAKDDTRTIALIGAALAKLLLKEAVREALRNLPGASIKLLILPTEWQVLLWHDGGSQILLRSEYSHVTGGFTAAMVNALEHGDLATNEGQERILEKVMKDYIAWLPDYERQDKYGLVFKG